MINVLHIINSCRRRDLEKNISQTLTTILAALRKLPYIRQTAYKRIGDGNGGKHFKDRALSISGNHCITRLFLPPLALLLIFGIYLGPTDFRSLFEFSSTLWDSRRLRNTLSCLSTFVSQLQVNNSRTFRRIRFNFWSKTISPSASSQSDYFLPNLHCSKIEAR